MNILLTHAASINNKGDAGIFSGMLASLRKVLPEADFTMTTIDSLEKNGGEFEGAKLVHSFFYYAVFSHKKVSLRFLETINVFVCMSLYLSFYSITGKMTKKLLPRRFSLIVEEYEQADLVIPVGGGQLSARRGFKQTAVIMLHALELFLPQRLKKTIIVYPQSIGPFGNSFQEWCIRKALKNVTAIFVREERSFELLQSWGMQKEKIHVAPDAGFLFNPGTKEEAKKVLIKYDLPKGKRLLGVTVREWLPAQEQEDFETNIANFLDFVADKDFSIIIIPQVVAEEHAVDDRMTGKNIFNKLKNKENAILITENIEPKIIKGVYENLDVLLGMRMHSNIYALTGFVPVLAIAYEHKTNGIMEQLNIGEYVVNVKDLNKNILKEKFESLLYNREQYIERLKSRIPEIINEAENTSLKLKLIYEGHSK